MVELGLGLLVLAPLGKSQEVVRILQASEVVKLAHSEARLPQDLVGRFLRLVASLLHLAKEHLEPKPQRHSEVSPPPLAARHQASACPPWRGRQTATLSLPQVKLLPQASEGL